MADDTQRANETPMPATMYRRLTAAERQELKELADNTARAMAELFEAAPEVAEYVRQNYRPVQVVHGKR